MNTLSEWNLFICKGLAVIVAPVAATNICLIAFVTCKLEWSGKRNSGRVGALK